MKLARVLLWVLCGLGLLLPVAVYRWRLGVPTLRPAQARALLADPDLRATLVDVRTEQEYSHEHLQGAVSWPLDRIRAYRAGQPLPEGLEGRPLLLICAGGVRSAEAVRRLQAQGVADVRSVRGGMQEWVALGAIPCAPGLTHAGARYADQRELAFRDAPRFEQALAVVTGFVVKPAYMLGALVLVWVLRRRREADLVALRWSMFWFFVGEAFCALNYLLAAEGSHLMEYLHSAGMVLAFGFGAYALLEAIDRRVIHFSEPGRACALTGLCQGCAKHAATSCGLRRLLLWVVLPSLLVLCLLPLWAPYRMQAYNTQIFGTLYSYFHAVVYQMYEIRLLPMMAILLLTGALVLLGWVEPHAARISRVLAAGAVGALGFSYFRLVLLAVFADNQVWFAAWEEITELLFVAGVATGLALFRRSLWAQPHESRQAVRAA